MNKGKIQAVVLVPTSVGFVDAVFQFIPVISSVMLIISDN